MALDTAPARLTPSEAILRGRGRPAATAPVNLDEAAVEVNALRVEAREVAGLIPHALAVHRYIQMVGESIEAERHAAYIVGSLERIARRHVDCE